MSERKGKYIKIDRKEFGPNVPAIGQEFTMKMSETDQIIKVRITEIHEEHFDAEFVENMKLELVGVKNCIRTMKIVPDHE